MNIYPKVKDLLEGYAPGRPEDTLDGAFTRLQKMLGKTAQIAMTRETLWCRNECGMPWLLAAIVTPDSIQGMKKSGRQVLCPPSTFIEEVLPDVEDDVNLHTGCAEDERMNATLLDRGNSTFFLIPLDYQQKWMAEKESVREAAITLDPEKYSPVAKSLDEVLDLMMHLKIEMEMRVNNHILVVLAPTGSWLIGALRVNGIIIMARDLAEATEIPASIVEKMVYSRTFKPKP